MSTELNHDGSITVIAYSLYEFAFELCELAAKGFIVTMENNRAPSGGLGSYYSAILVPRHHYRIDLQGNHLNVPKTEDTQPEVEVKLHTEEPKQDVEGVPTTQNEKGQPKTRTQTKKTT